ncbi:MAG: ABC transporter permease [Anaerolineae bacterium]|nr:ABC transporter permease [Anaerolineae bacterium]
MLDILRYFWRRKLRTALTIFAVMVGIFAVTAVGGIAEQLERSIVTVEQDALRRIMLWPRDYETTLGEATIRQLRRIPGVAGVTMQASGYIAPPEDAVIRISVNPEMFVGTRSDIPGLEYEPPVDGLQLWDGRLPAPSSRTETVVTWALAEAKNLEVGDTLLIRERPFTVVGIWEKSPTPEGRTANISYEAAENLLGEVTYPYIYVIPRPGADAEALAVLIEELLPEVQAYSPAETVAQARQQILIFSAVVGASGVMSLLIGTFTIVNTMVVSVQERRREIGLKKALGAADGHILAEVIIEAILIAGIGGVSGVGAGALAGNIANRVLFDSLGMQLYLLTPRLGVGAIVFSVMMGALAGIYPAWRAARLDPVIAFRGGDTVAYAGRGLKRLLYLIRRNARSGLTVGGIAIGIFALVVLGSLTEALNTYVRNVTEATNDLIVVSPAKAGIPVNRSTARVLRRFPGVKDVILTNTSEMPIDFERGQNTAEGEETVNVQVWAHESETGDMGICMPVRNEIVEGRFVSAGSKDEIVLGGGRAELQGTYVGDVVFIKDHPFTVVGIWGRIPFDVGGHDMSAFVSLDALSWLEGNQDGVTGVAVRAESMAAIAPLTGLVETELPGLEVMNVTEVIGDIQQAFMGLIAAMIGIFSIAVFVGSVSVINTMVIAVNEQTRQIGLKKAVGAENGDILAEVLMDAASLGAVGGVLGVGLAWVAAMIFNPIIRANMGLDMFRLSPRLAVGAILLSVILGMLSGLFPARRAAQLDPVIALHAD